ncbi:MAG: hypothetical protein U0547_09370 [Dehalococcoidia bacterium]
MSTVTNGPAPAAVSTYLRTLVALGAKFDADSAAAVTVHRDDMLRTVARAVRAHADGLAALIPPDEIRLAHGRLTAATSAEASHFEALLAAGRSLEDVEYNVLGEISDQRTGAWSEIEHFALRSGFPPSWRARLRP